MSSWRFAVSETISLATATLALAAATAAAHAGDARNTVNVQAVVQYADLDISRTPGAIALLARIKSTARSLCQPALQDDTSGGLSFERCAQDATERAVATVDSPLVSSLYGNHKQPVSVAQSN